MGPRNTPNTRKDRIQSGRSGSRDNRAVISCDSRVSWAIPTPADRRAQSGYWCSGVRLSTEVRSRRCLELGCSVVLAVRFTTVRHSNDQNHKDFVLDLVDYPVVADPDPKRSSCADELLGSVRARIICKAPNGRAGSRVNGQRKSAAQSFGTVKNRRMRTRMSGGVGAGGSNPPWRPDSALVYTHRPTISGHTRPRPIPRRAQCRPRIQSQ